MLVAVTDGGVGSSRLTIQQTINELNTATKELLTLHNYIMANYIPSTETLKRIVYSDKSNVTHLAEGGAVSYTMELFVNVISSFVAAGARTRFVCSISWFIAHTCLRVAPRVHGRLQPPTW